MEIVTETSIENKKALKKQFVRVGANLLFREVFLVIAEIMVGIVFAVYFTIKNNGLDNGNIEDVIEQLMINPFVSIIPILIGFIPVMHFMKKNIGKERIFNKNKKFTIKNVIILFILLLGLNYLCGIVSIVMESGLNVIGFTMSESEDILKSFNSPSMLIYIGVVAPVVEELIYRGMVLRFLDKFDKGLAIVGSGVLFGLMHGNFYQIFMAVGIGIFLGYIAEEYSIKLTIILHMTNNIFSFLADRLIEKVNVYSTISGDILSGIIMVIAVFILVITVIRNFQKVKSEFVRYTPKKQMCKYFFTSLSVILLISINLLEACSQISKL